jgi:hypothetical protein
MASFITAFCLAYFLSKKGPIEHTVTSLKIVDEAEMQTPGYLG